MKKMPCVFVHTEFSEKYRQRSTPCTPEVTPGCEWVLAGEGKATRKWDGTACAVIDGGLYARYDAKQGKTPPLGAIPCQPAPDPVSLHWPHWLGVAGRPEFKWHREAMTKYSSLEDGTYELCGPAINTNHERLTEHVLIRHGVDLLDAPRTHSGLLEYLSRVDLEGVVFHHPDGRMAKIRKTDFCLPWPPK